MGKVDEYLSQGIVAQDSNDPEKVIFNVPVKIKKSAIEFGGFEAFAGAYGWAESSGVPVHEAAINIVHDFIKKTFRESVVNFAKAKAEQELSSKIEDLL